MDVKIENGKIIFTENHKEYSFEAHGESPRPSIMPSVSVGGRHLSDRSDKTKNEKHTAVQDVVIGNGMAAWYTQEFIPDGNDYKLSKKSELYIGDFSADKEMLIYKGECYGDLCFYENDLFFNIGNKVAVYHIDSRETEVLFKHSGIKKSCINLHVTPKRIFFQHWTHSNNNTMWYDRETKELINPHFDGSIMFFLDDETIIYHGLDHTWLYDVNTKKKKRFFSSKERNKIIGDICTFFEIPKEYFSYYISTWSRLKLNDMKNDRLYFECELSYRIDGSDNEDAKPCIELSLPSWIVTHISCDLSGKDVKIEADENNIIRK